MPATLEGADQLIKAIRKTEIDAKDLKDVHRDSAKLIVDEARRGVVRRSGKLRGSVRAGATKTAGVVRAGGKRVPWAGPYHFGHFNRPQGGFIRPNPFLYDALDDRAEQVVRNYEKFVNRVVARNF